MKTYIAMNDVRAPEPDTETTRKQLIELFLRRSQTEVEQMRRGVPSLIKGDDAAWREVRFNSQRIAGTASALQLGVLSACAKELSALTEERFSRVTLDAHFLLTVTSAIEMVAIEIARLLSGPAL
jgi:hypothetical protein